MAKVEDITRINIGEGEDIEVETLPEQIQKAIQLLNRWRGEEIDLLDKHNMVKLAIENLGAKITNAIKEHLAKQNEEPTESVSE